MFVEGAAAYLPYKSVLKDKVIDILDFGGATINCMICSIYGNTPFDKMECANNHQQAIVELIDAVAVGAPLSGQMRKCLTAAAGVVLINDGMSLKDVIRCLENHVAREEFINKIPPEFMIYLDDQVETLKQLDDVKEYKEEMIDEATGKKVKIVKRYVEGTKYSKVGHIMDRINSLCLCLCRKQIKIISNI